MLSEIKDFVPWMAEGIGTRKSDIHENGLFTSTDIRSGSILLRFGGMIFKKQARYNGEVMRSTSTFLAEDIILAEPSSGQKDSSDYLNHSCDPNLGMLDAVCIKAIRDIRTGEELTVDYAFWEGDNDWKLKSECRCGSRQCRISITGKDWMNVKSNDERFRNFAPFLKRRILMLSTKKG